MSILDKAIAAITPPEAEADRENARNIARGLAQPGDWLSMALEHHLAIEAAFDACKSAAGGQARLDAMKRLAVVLNGHSAAEETVLYPAMEQEGEKGGSAMAYSEQQMAKIQMARLEKIDPASQDWLDKLGHIEGAVRHHIYEEEGTWFPRLKQVTLDSDQQHLTQRFAEEYARYAGDSAGGMTGENAGATGRPLYGHDTPQATNEMTLGKETV